MVYFFLLIFLLISEEKDRNKNYLGDGVQVITKSIASALVIFSCHLELGANICKWRNSRKVVFTRQAHLRGPCLDCCFLSKNYVIFCRKITSFFVIIFFYYLFSSHISNYYNNFFIKNHEKYNPNTLKFSSLYMEICKDRVGRK